MGRVFQIVIGVVATLALAGWMWLAFQPNNSQSANQPPSQPDSRYVAGGRQCEAASLRAISDPISRRDKEDECSEKRDQHRREQSDLVQQTRSANGSEIVAAVAKDDARITLLAAILSMCTTALLVWTFWETRSANRTQLRAYVLPHISLYHRDHAPPRERRKIANELLVSVHAKNSGQTPATDYVNWMGVEIKAINAEDTLELPSRPLAPKSVSVISSQGVIDTPYILNPSAAETTGLKDGSLALFVWGKLSYHDVFRRRRHSYYRMKYQGVWPPRPGSQMTFCDRGNSHT